MWTAMPGDAHASVLGAIPGGAGPVIPADPIPGPAAESAEPLALDPSFGFALPRFLIRYSAGAGFSVLAAPQARIGGPVDINAVSRRAYDSSNNWLRIENSAGQQGVHTPGDANQVFSSIFDSANNAIHVNCVSGCSTTFGTDIQGVDTSHQKVVGLDGIPLSTAAPANGQVYTYNSASNQWIPASAGTLLPTGAQNAFLAWNGTAWTPQVPTFSTLSGTLADTQLSAAYSGVGACPANQFTTSLGRNAAPQCASPVSASGAPANQFATGITANGALLYSQPGFASLAGVATAGQLPAASSTAQGAIALGKDLGGTALLPQVTGLQGRPVASTAPAANQFLSWNTGSSQWQPAQPAFSTLSGSLGLNQTPLTTNGDFLTVANGSLTRVAIGGANQCLQVNGAGSGYQFGACGGTTNPGGSNAQFQFNNGGNFGGASNFTYNTSSGAVTLQPAPSQDAVSLTLAPSVASPAQDIFEVYKDSAKTTKALWVDASGNLNFAGNNANYGASGQPTASHVNLFGGASPNAGSYLAGTDSNGGHGTYLYFDPTAAGTVSLETGVIGGASTASNRLCTPANALCGTSFASQSANYIFAAPAGSSGVPAFRFLVAADIPVLNQSTTGNAATASALAAAPAACTTGQFATGVAASGNANCAQVIYSQLSGAPSSLPPNGSANGDLSGSYPNPVVAKLNGGAIPPSAAVIGTNSSGQIVAPPSQSANMFFGSPNGLSGAPVFRSLVAADIPLLNQSTTGNAATATALAAAPTQCSGGQFATGITAGGTANCSTPSGSGTVGSGTASHLAYYNSSAAAVADMGTDFTFGTHTLSGGSSSVLDMTAGAFRAASLQPDADGINAVRLFASNGTTAVLDVDTTNFRLGINTTPSYSLDVGGTINATALQTSGAGNSGMAVQASGAVAPAGLINNIVYAGTNNTTPCVLINTTGTNCTPILTTFGPVFGASGASHSIGAVPDPGSTAGTAHYLREDGSWQIPSGGVTSVGLSLPGLFTVSGSPVTGTGTLTGTLASQSANLFFAAPNGSAGAPTFRALVAADVPTLNQSTTGNAATATALAAIPAQCSGGQFATGIAASGTANCATPASSGGTVTSVGLTLPSIFAVSGSPVTGTGTLSGTLASQSANLFFAAPNGSAGAPTFRALVAADVPTLNQSTTGNAATATALAAIPAQCSAGQFATGIAASGTANCATPSGSGSVGTGTATHLAYYNATGSAVTDMGADFAFNTHTLAGGSSALLDMSAATTVNAFKVPAQGGNAPTADGSVAVDTNTHSIAWGVNGNTVYDCLPSDFSCVVLKENMTSFSTSQIMLNRSQINANASAGSLIGSLGLPDNQAIEIATDATSGHGQTWETGSLGVLGNTSNWRAKVRFRQPQATSDTAGEMFRIGFTSVPNGATTLAAEMVLRLDTTASDTLWTFAVGDASVVSTAATGVSALDSNFHTLQVWSNVAQEVWFQLDALGAVCFTTAASGGCSGAGTTVHSAHLPTAQNLFFHIADICEQASSPAAVKADIGRFVIQIRGLSTQ